MDPAFHLPHQPISTASRAESAFSLDQTPGPRPVGDFCRVRRQLFSVTESARGDARFSPHRMGHKRLAAPSHPGSSGAIPTAEGCARAKHTPSPPRPGLSQASSPGGQG